jgi:hypothetical protein
MILSGQHLPWDVVNATSFDSRLFHKSTTDCGRGEQEVDNQVFDESHAVGMDLDEVQSSAGRQFLASLVVGVIIIAVAGLISLRPVHHDSAGLGLHRVASVQEPTFLTQHVAGRIRHEIELP